MYIGNLDVSTTEGQLAQMINNELNIVTYNIEQLRTQHRNFKSFKVTISKEDLGKLKDPQNIGEGIVVREYTWRKKEESQNIDGNKGRRTRNNNYPQQSYEDSEYARYFNPYWFREWPKIPIPVE
jgi:hypothetical protein